MTSFASTAAANSGNVNGNGSRRAETGGPGLALARMIKERVAQTVVGQETVVESILIALLTGGHLLLQGVPGLAKTLLVHSIAKAVDLQFSRVQFTIDLLPADIVGAEILDEKTREFRLHQGPVFTNLLLADEINRATPKVQSALLEAMQERKVTVGNRTLRLPVPFLVIATQNPIEQAGTFELPEAQLDRFMMCQRLDYPSFDHEAEVVRRSLGYGLQRSVNEPAGAHGDGPGQRAAPTEGAVPRSAFDSIPDAPALHLRELTAAMEQVQKVHVSEVFIRHCVDLVTATRNHADIELGCSPRAGIALVQAARARAYIAGRDYAVTEDLFALAESVMLHRMRLSYDALARGVRPRDVLNEVLDPARG
ncbi:MoxR family ATPase [soil metagenome]